MKKRFCAAAFALLLMMLILPCASADTIYPAPEARIMGQPFDHKVATVDTGAVVSATLPEGLWLETEDAEEGTDIYLRGFVAAAGIYDCIINVDTSFFTFSISVTPEPPLVAVSPSLRCYPGEPVQVSISATGSADGQLGYQWYESLTAAEPGSPVGGAIEDSLMVPTEQLGTLYYRCLVSETVNGLTSTTMSDPISVTVEELAVSALFIETMPNRTEYMTGDTLDTEGLTVRAQLDNDDVRILTEGFGVYPTRLDQPGTQEIEVSYQGKACVFTVNVQQDEEAVTGIGVLTLPDKTSYVVGDTLDTTGLAIRAYTNKGYWDVSDGLECSPTVFEVPGNQTVTIRYSDKECTFTVPVSQVAVPASIAVARLPDKIQYAIGEPLDTTGLVIRQVNSNNESTDVYTGFTCSPTQFDAVGHQEVIVTYGDLSCHFNVTVIQAPAAPASPSPEPTPILTVSPPPSPTPVPEVTEPQPPTPTPQASVPQTPAPEGYVPQAPAAPAVPVTATPAPSVKPSPAPSSAPAVTAAPQPSSAPAPSAAPAAARTTGNAKTFFIVVVIASVIALAALGAYVFVMNLGGAEQAVQAIKDFFQRPRRR